MIQQSILVILKATILCAIVYGLYGIETLTHVAPYLFLYVILDELIHLSREMLSN